LVQGKPAFGPGKNPLTCLYILRFMKGIQIPASQADLKNKPGPEKTRSLV